MIKFKSYERIRQILIENGYTESPAYFTKGDDDFSKVNLLSVAGKSFSYGEYRKSSFVDCPFTNFVRPVNFDKKDERHFFPNMPADFLLENLKEGLDKILDES